MCLTILQKYSVIKLYYIGENKQNYLKAFFDGIEDIMFTQIGLSSEKNFENFCKLIFSLSKNFNIIDLLNNTNMFSNTFKFMESVLKFCKIVII
jgi:hypothetical protein